MMEQITQSILMARGIGGEDWANLLFIVVMAVLWLAAGLIKMIAKKGSPPEQSKPEDSPGQPPRPKETWQQRLARKAEEIQRRFEEEAGVRPPVRDAAPRPAQAPGGSPGRRDEPAARPQPQAAIRRDHQVARQREAQRAVAAAGQYTAAASLTSIPAEAPEPLKPDDVQLSVPRESDGFELAAIIDYSDRDAWKKAVLHYEILGKPLALRESPGETIAF
jgi:cell division protein FtsN